MLVYRCFVFPPSARRSFSPSFDRFIRMSDMPAAPPCFLWAGFSCPRMCETLRVAVRCALNRLWLWAIFLFLLFVRDVGLRSAADHAGCGQDLGHEYELVDRIT